jgi:predicted hydrocarbon binding protein
MDDFTRIKEQLVLTGENRLMIGPVAMILMPAWFFSGIMKRVVQEAGYDRAAKIYYEAGFDGAYRWGKVQIEAGLTGRQIMEQYLGAMTHRGWGRFEIIRFDDTAGSGLFRLYHSAVALENAPADRPACLWVPGALAGAMQVIMDHAERRTRVIAQERRCLAQAADCCEFVVEPAPAASCS